jgi:hypothetical protein
MASDSFFSLAPAGEGNRVAIRDVVEGALGLVQERYRLSAPSTIRAAPERSPFPASRGRR